MSLVVSILDTSILCELFDIPGRASQYARVLHELDVRRQAKQRFAIPLATVIETGNHIGQISRGDVARQTATRFVGFVRDAVAQVTPDFFVTTDLLPLYFPNEVDALRWLDAFPGWATRKVGFGDLTIVEEWRRLCRQFAHHPQVEIAIWSLDAHLSAFQWSSGQPLPTN